MLQKLYSRLDLQLATLSAILIVCGLLSLFLGFTPLLRFSFTNLFYGIVGGVIIVLLKIGFAQLINKGKWVRAIESLLDQETLGPVSLAKILIQATGEETLLRGFIFVPLIDFLSFFGSNLLALVINAFISIGIYSSKGKIGYLEAIHATILGMIYLFTYSMFAVIVARFISEVALLLASHYELTHLLSRRFSYVAKQPI